LSGSAKNWPNFFIVGAANSGTTSLYSYLKQHPRVFMPALKEPHYFSQIRPSHEQRYMRTYVTNEQVYLRLFSKAANFNAIGEASPSYLFDPVAPLRIHKTVPRAKIIILLRDPVERTHSHYLMDVREGLQERPFYEALQHDWTRKEKGWGVSHLYVELGLYAEQIKRYLSTFAPEQVLILTFNDLARAGESDKSAIARVLNFLQVDPSPLDHIDTRAENSFGVARWPWVRRLAGNNLVRRAGQMIVPLKAGSNHTIKTYVFQRYFVKSAPKPEIDPIAKTWLCSIFDSDIHSLETILGRRLPDLRCSWDLPRAGAVQSEPIFEY
jgi:Sulfotransferase family